MCLRRVIECLRLCAGGVRWGSLGGLLKNRYRAGPVDGSLTLSCLGARDLSRQSGAANTRGRSEASLIFHAGPSAQKLGNCTLLSSTFFDVPKPNHAKPDPATSIQQLPSPPISLSTLTSRPLSSLFQLTLSTQATLPRANHNPPFHQLLQPLQWPVPSRQPVSHSSLINHRNTYRSCSYCRRLRCLVVLLLSPPGRAYRALSTATPSRFHHEPQLTTTLQASPLVARPLVSSLLPRPPASRLPLPEVSRSPIVISLVPSLSVRSVVTRSRPSS